MAELTCFPAKMEWKNRPLAWKVLSPNSVAIEAGASTDWFIDPDGSYDKDSAPSLMFLPPDSEYVVGARVKVGFQSTYDAGCIQVQIDPRTWAKLCFEYTPLGCPSVVSVVTRGVSDDCNSAVLEKNEVFLRAAIRPKSIAFHYSADGRFWNLVRYFSLNDPRRAKIGLSAQSPTGRRCEAVFSEIAYRPGVIKDIRSGE